MQMNYSTTPVKQDLGRRRSRAKVSPARKVFAILKNIFVWLVAITAVAMMIFTIISVLTFDRNDRDLFGYKALIIRSDSMSATDFKAGDLILVKEVDPSTLKEGDIIAYQSTATESFGETITHKIPSLTVSEDKLSCLYHLRHHDQCQRSIRSPTIMCSANTKSLYLVSEYFLL